MENKFKFYPLVFLVAVILGIYGAIKINNFSYEDLFFLKAHFLHFFRQDYFYLDLNGDMFLKDLPNTYSIPYISNTVKFRDFEPQFFSVIMFGLLAAIVALGLFHFFVGSGKKIGKKETRVRGTEVSAPAKLKKVLKGEPSRLTIGGIPYPKRLETQGFLLVGSTGSGKSTGISELLAQIRPLNEKMIIVDPGGEYLQKFGRNGDILLNPFDERTANWNPFKEIKSAFDVDTIVRQIIPDGEGHGAEWLKYAQTYFEASVLKIWGAGDKFPLTFLTTLFTKLSGSQVQEFFKHTAGAKYFEKGSEGILGSVNTILSRYIKNLSKLDPKGEFSIRDWVRSDAKNWLFITYQAQNKASLEDFIGTWIAVAGNEVLALPPDLDRRIWLCFDEFPRVGKVQNFSEILTNGRKNGLAAIVGMQTTSQIQKLYGKEEAETLLSCLNTALILKNADPSTADTMSKMLGQAEVERVTVNETSKGQKSTSTTRTTTPAILPSEILNLPTNVGYLKIAGLVTKIALTIKDYQKRIEPFVPTNRFNRVELDDGVDSTPHPESAIHDEIKTPDSDEPGQSLSIFGS